jgi:hypothetical protein
VLGENLRTLDGATKSFRVTRTIDAPDPLIAGERALSVVRADRALKNERFDPWHPPSLEVTDVAELEPRQAAVNTAFEWS